MKMWYSPTVSGVYVISGSDSYQQDLFLEELRLNLQPKTDEPVVPEILGEGLSAWQQVFDSANTLSLWAGPRLIVVRASLELKPEDEPLWLSYLDSPAFDVTLVVFQAKVDGRRKLIKHLEQAGCLRVFNNPKPADMPSWLERILKQLGLQATHEAKRLLLTFVGGQLALLHLELQKLSIYLHPVVKIEAADVAALVLDGEQGNVFAVVDDLFDHKPAQAVAGLRHVLTSGTAPLGFLGLLARHVRILLKMEHAMTCQLPQNDWAKYVGVPPFAVQRYKAQLNKLGHGELTKWLACLAQADRLLKSSSIPDKMWLERMSISGPRI